MDREIKNYKCPACGGPLHFDGELGKVACDYCDSIFEIGEIESLYGSLNNDNDNAFREADTKESFDKTDTKEVSEKINAQYDEGEMWSEEDLEELRSYVCPSCGAELTFDSETAATSCPYCDNPTIVPGRLSGGLKPELVIPFKLDKSDAKKALKKFYKNKRFLPDVFAEENHIDEIKGVYVPFWLFDTVAEGSVTFEAQKIGRVYVSGNYEITEHNHYDITVTGKIPFEKVPADASERMADDYMDALEPYDYRELKPFSNAYLPGYMAYKYDISKEESVERFKQRVLSTVEDEFRKSFSGYISASALDKSIDLNEMKVHYALLPVWTLNTSWNGQKFLFAMNGQTGKIVGDFPIDDSKRRKSFFSKFLPLATILTAISLSIVWLL